MALAKLVQTDFSAGMFRTRGAAPENGVRDLVNSLVARDGTVYKRGGSVSKATTSPLDATPIRMLWSGWLAPGERTLMATSVYYAALNPADETQLTAIQDDFGAQYQPPAPVKPVTLSDFVVVPAGGGVVWAGFAGSGGASTVGAANVTADSATVTGTGTSFNLAAAGTMFRVGTRVAVVKSVQSATSLTLTEPWGGATATGQAYALKPIMTMAEIGGRTGSYFAVAGERLVACEGSRAYMSARNDPFNFQDTDYHELPGGVQIIGAQGLGDQLLLFTTDGLWIASNLSYDLTDAYGNVQQRLDHPQQNLILWADAGIAAYGSAIIVPATDGVWQLGSDAQPRLLSRSITDYYVNYVRAGRIPGRVSVYRGHYILPVLDTAGATVDVLVCNVQQPSSNDLYPWSRMTGAGAALSAVASRALTPGRPRQLLGASSTHTRLLDCSYWFEPSGVYKNDHDGTTPHWDFIGRDIQTGEYGVPNLVRRMRARYELLDAGSDDPKIQAAYGIGQMQPAGTDWGGFVWGAADWAASKQSGITTALSGQAPESDGDAPYIWEVNYRARQFRPQLQSSSPAALLRLRSLELLVRPQTRI